jgi:26S proteasome regulatory subunit T4
VRTELREAEAKYDRTEADLQALQSVGQIIGEVLKPLGERFIVKASSGPRWVWEFCVLGAAG